MIPTVVENSHFFSVLVLLYIKYAWYKKVTTLSVDGTLSYTSDLIILILLC